LAKTLKNQIPLKVKQTYLKGKSVFIVLLLVVGLTIITVYLSGINYNRSLTSNFYISLGIISIILFVFMTYGLYFGIGLLDNFPKFQKFERGRFLPTYGHNIDLPGFDVGEGIAGIVLSILLWIGMAILFIILLALVEALFWLSIFIILAMLYWLFFRALKVVFSKSKRTKDDLQMSIIYSLTYTILYTGWMFGIVYLTELIK
jgi:hypothetical protein